MYLKASRRPVSAGAPPAGSSRAEPAGPSRGPAKPVSGMRLLPLSRPLARVSLLGSETSALRRILWGEALAAAAAAAAACWLLLPRRSVFFFKTFVCRVSLAFTLRWVHLAPTNVQTSVTNWRCNTTASRGFFRILLSHPMSSRLCRTKGRNDGCFWLVERLPR